MRLDSNEHMRLPQAAHERHHRVHSGHSHAHARQSQSQAREASPKLSQRRLARRSAQVGPRPIPRARVHRAQQVQGPRRSFAHQIPALAHQPTIQFAAQVNSHSIYLHFSWYFLFIC